MAGNNKQARKRIACFRVSFSCMIYLGCWWTLRICNDPMKEALLLFAAVWPHKGNPADQKVGCVVRSKDLKPSDALTAVQSMSEVSHRV